MTDERTFVETFPLRRRQNCKWALHRDGESHGSSPVRDTHFDVCLLAIAEDEPTTNICQPDAFVGIGLVPCVPFSGIRDAHRDSIALAFYLHAHISPTHFRAHPVPNPLFNKRLIAKTRN